MNASLDHLGRPEGRMAVFYESKSNPLFEKFLPRTISPFGNAIHIMDS